MADRPPAVDEAIAFAPGIAALLQPDGQGLGVDADRAPDPNGVIEQREVRGVRPGANDHRLEHVERPQRR